MKWRGLIIASAYLLMLVCFILIASMFDAISLNEALVAYAASAATVSIKLLR